MELKYSLNQLITSYAEKANKNIMLLVIFNTKCMRNERVKANKNQLAVN